MALVSSSTPVFVKQPATSSFTKYGAGDFLVQVIGKTGDGSYTKDGDLWLPIITGSKIQLIDYDVIEPANPAAGADFSTTLPAGYFYEVTGITMKLVPDATVASRYFIIIFQNSSNKILNNIEVANHITASNARYLSLGLHYTAEGEYEVSNVYNDGIGNPYLNGTDKIISDIKNIQSGDQLSDIKISVNRYAYYSEFTVKDCSSFAFDEGSDTCNVFRIG
jgi:hypothetical protein